MFYHRTLFSEHHNEENGDIQKVPRFIIIAQTDVVTDVVVCVYICPHDWTLHIGGHHRHVILETGSPPP